MSKSSAFAVGLLCFSVTSPAHAADESAFQTPERPSTNPRPQPDKAEKPSRAADASSDHSFMLALEGFATAPTDVGIEAGIETPFGLRVFGDYGWIPAASLAWIHGASVSDGGANATLDVTGASGHLFRLKIGIRPIRSLGLYLDAGYGHAELSATGSVTGSVAGVGSLSDAYRASTNVDLWLAELGYQWKFENRLVVGLGLGFMGTLGAHTKITSVDGASDSGALGVAETAADGALQAYGFLPTLNLRAGFNVL
ncbi:MAG TPA: hypothetical protein VMI54_11720 [Polyangiaceae bacterium]|nr:hypothetical protein [Polyangiaceae bacterium]